MKKVSTKKNLVYNSFYQVLNLLVPLITAPYAARIFGADGTGIQSYVVSISAYFTLFAQLGTQYYGQREIAMCRSDRKKVSKTFWEIELISVLSTVVCLIAWFILIVVVGKYQPYFLVLTLNIINVAFDITWFFAGHEQFQTIVIRNTFVKAMICIALFVFCKDKDDLIIFIALTCLSTLLGTLSLWPMLLKYLVKVDMKNLQLSKHFKQTLVYFVPTIATTVYTVLDKTMIGVITQDRFENGFYEQTTKVTKIATAFITAINGVMYSKMSNLFAENKIEELKSKLKTSIDYIMFLSIPMVMGLIGIAKDFVPVFFGPGYEKVIILLSVYSFLIIITGISSCLGNQYLVPVGKRAKSSNVIIIGAAVNLCLNIIMIPLWKSMGATIASVISETLIAALFIRMSQGVITLRQIWESSWKRLIAGGIMLPVVLFIGSFTIRVMKNNGLVNGVAKVSIQIAVGVIVYMGLLIVLKDEGQKEYWGIIKKKIPFIKKL